MSLNIKDAVYGLGTKLGVDMSHAPASNIADTIDYISNGVGAHTGVIAEAVDKLEVGGGTPDWMFIIDAAPVAPDSTTLVLNKTYPEVKQLVDSGVTSSLRVGILRMFYAGANRYFYILHAGYNTQSDEYEVETNLPDLTFTTGSEDGYPTVEDFH